MSWGTAVEDLRVKLSDGPQDKFQSFKKVVGEVDGTNTLFKTFEFRRLTDFTVTGQSPLGVYVAGTLIDPITDIASDDPNTGIFTLSEAPTGRQEVSAVYYTQWFTDAELEEFLRLSNNWLGFGDDWTTLNSGLRPAALCYAEGEAYQKLATRWTVSLSSNYRLEDAPNAEQRTPVDWYRSLAADRRKMADTLRNDFYKRQGQEYAPNRGYMTRGVREIVPQR